MSIMPTPIKTSQVNDTCYVTINSIRTNKTEPSLYQIDIKHPYFCNRIPLIYRFSDFHALKDELLKILKKCLQRKQCSGCCSYMYSYLQEKYPKRCWFSSKSNKKIQERRNALELIFNTILFEDLLSARSTFRKCFTAREIFCEVLFKFLRLDEQLTTWSLFAEQTHDPLLPLYPISFIQSLKHDAHKKSDAASKIKYKKEKCSICLDDMTMIFRLQTSEEDKVKITYENCTKDCVKLFCGHFFHENCISMWTAIEKKCPLCRAYVCSKRPWISQKKLNNCGWVSVC